MKTKLTALKSLLIVSAFLLPVNLMAQEDVGDLFKSSPADATKLVDAYMTPLFKGMGVGLNSGWANTAKAKNFLRFDLRITASAAFVPNVDKAYDSRTLGLQSVRPVAGQSGIGPTAFGDDEQGSLMELHNNGTPVPGSTFNLPEGSGINFVPSPQVQLTVGLPKNIDISLRLVPNVGIGDVSINQFGLGTKVELFPLLMGKKDKLMPFDLAIALGFTNTKATIDLDVNNGKYDNQKVEVKFKGFSTEAIVSKNLLFFTPFVSVGYNSSNSSLNGYGTYDFQTSAGTATFSDPVSIKHKDLSALKASLGFQMNLAFLRIYASYTQSEYGYFNGGLGFGIGK